MTAQIPAETLAELRGLLIDASPRPWRASREEGNDLHFGRMQFTRVDTAERNLFAVAGMRVVDAYLIAAAVNALPALLDALAAETARAEAAEAKVARVASYVEELRADNILTPESRYTRDVIVRELAAALADEENR